VVQALKDSTMSPESTWGSPVPLHSSSSGSCYSGVVTLDNAPCNHWDLSKFNEVFLFLPTENRYDAVKKLVKAI
jgi:hypothetical protein